MCVLADCAYCRSAYKEKSDEKNQYIRSPVFDEVHRRHVYMSNISLNMKKISDSRYGKKKIAFLRTCPCTASLKENVCLLF